MSHDPNAVTDHYGRTDLTESILNALRAADIDVEHLSLDDLAPVEEFHIGGREATTELAQLAKIDRSDRVLDIGCGIGGPARALAAMYGCRVTGVDLTEPFCEAATELNRRTGLSDLIEIHHGSALDLPLADASIDVVWMQHVSMNIEDKAGLYCEARRVLVPEGRVAIYEILAGPGGEIHFPVPWARAREISFLATPQQLQQTLVDSGLQKRDWIDVTSEATSWFSNMLQRIAVEGSPPLSLATLMGADFSAMAQNVLRNLKEDRLRVVRAIYLPV